MNKYTVFFEIYGKKLKTTVKAKSEAEAKKLIAEKIIFYKVIKEIDYNIPDVFKDIFKL
jgi:hypothetical protein